LPLLFCLLPVAVGALVIVAIPEQAIDFYLEVVFPNFSTNPEIANKSPSYIDWFILALGGAFFIGQLLLAWWALQWQERSFDERPDHWIQRLNQASDWFPLLGLFGTLIHIIETFARIRLMEKVLQADIIKMYAPSLTTAASGLLMAFLNILPLWLVSTGRGLILSLAANPPAPVRKT
jgi:hypothetical protein